MRPNRGRVIIIGVIIFIALFFVLGFMGIIPGFRKSSGPTDPNLPTTPITLKFWGVDDNSAFSEVIKVYEQQVPKIQVQYTAFGSEEAYRQALINALAERRGPDVFMIHSSWLHQDRGKIIPVASSPFTYQAFTQSFPQVVIDDFTSGGSVYASPLYLDSLALIYNKDIFNSKAVIYPPKTLDDLVKAVSRIREVDNNKNIKLSAIALGGAKNIGNAADIVSALSFQAGSKIFGSPSGENQVSFDSGVSEALKFYLQFASSYNPYYTWNESFEDSIGAFASGKTAMLFDYYESLKKIAEKNPFVNLGFSALPQLDPSKPADVSSYWGLTASSQSAYPYASWHFIRSLTMDSALNSTYLKNTQRLPALLSLINSGLGSEVDVFLRSFLFSKTWEKPDGVSVEKIFEEGIGNVLSGKVTQQKSLDLMETAINNLY